MKTASLKSRKEVVPTKEIKNRDVLGFKLPTSRWALLLEDDPNQYETVKAFLEKGVRTVVDEVILVTNESDFNKVLSEIMSSPEQVPTFVVSDVMMPWTSIDEIATNPPPSDVREGTFQRAGIRCWRRFREVEAARRTPWVFFTVLDEDHLLADNDGWDRFTGYVSKSAPLSDLDYAISEFFDRIKN
jgi:CheY-like chemotaxis protein